MYLLSNGIQKSNLTCRWEYTVEKFDTEELNTYWNLKLTAVPIVCLPPGTYLVSVNHIASHWPGRWRTFFSSDWLQSQRFRRWRWCYSIVKEEWEEFIRRLGLGDRGGAGWMSGATVGWAPQALVRCATCVPHATTPSASAASGVGHTFLHHLLLRGSSGHTIAAAAASSSSHHHNRSTTTVCPFHSSSFVSGSPFLRPCHRALRLLHQRYILSASLVNPIW